MVKTPTPRRNRARLRDLEKQFAEALVAAAPTDAMADDPGMPGHESHVEEFCEGADGAAVTLRARDGAWISLSSSDGKVWEGACALVGEAASSAGRILRFSLERAVSGMMIVALARSILSGERDRDRDHALEL